MHALTEHRPQEVTPDLYAFPMKRSRVKEQQIAVFGESGSGKTVMLSSFYGATQEPKYVQANRFNVVADSATQGTRLHQNYLGMKNSARRPDATRFAATSYSFSVKLKKDNPEAKRNGPFDALRLVWHDYPGEWFEQDVSGPEEAQRRVDTFKSLLGSDVAMLLVDGQRLLDNAGEEERYLKSLFTNFSNGLLALKDDLLEDGRPLARFPRIWLLALSKADLLPEYDVADFRDLLVDKAGEEINELRELIGGFVKFPDALSVGEDFMLLSSAKFTAEKIEVDNRIGVNLTLPMAAMLPLDRYLRWAKEKQISGKLAEDLLRRAGPVVRLLSPLAKKLPGPWSAIAMVFGPEVVKEISDLAGEKLKKANEDARANHDYVRAALTRFRIELEEAEGAKILLRSQR